MLVDDTDKKIILALIKDARASLKDIAKTCDLSSVSVLNRVKRLKKNGVITGATLFPSLNKLGLNFAATVGLETESKAQDIITFFDEHASLVELSASFGEYDLCALVFAEDISSLNQKIDAVKRRFKISKAIVNVWSGRPEMNYENINLNPEKRGSENGQA